MSRVYVTSNIIYCKLSHRAENQLLLSQPSFLLNLTL